MPTESIKLVECPRDAWQGMLNPIPANAKAAYLRALIAAGFKHIDAVSFVSGKAVPQMADSEEVLRLLDPPGDVDIIGLVVNEKGAQRAIESQAVRTLGFPYSVSPTFLQRNQRQSLEEAYDELENVKQLADDAGLGLVVYVSMAFGNPYEDPWEAEEVVEAVGIAEQMGVVTVSLADTVGLASPERIGAVVAAVTGKFSYLEIGVHLHSRPERAVEKLLAAYAAGARRFDSTLGGFGGCPFAQDALVGNIATERVLEAAARLGIEPPLPEPLGPLLLRSAEIAGRYGGPAVVH
jgi:hydroxymethylglutaryl-CoA lyase